MYIKSSNKKQEYIMVELYICSMSVNYSIFILCKKPTCAHQSHIFLISKKKHIFNFIVYYISMRVTYPVTSEGMLH